MKKILSLILMLAMCLSLCACGSTSPETTEAPATTEVLTTVPETTAEPEPNYVEILPAELQGVWGDTSVAGFLSLYAFRDMSVETYIVNMDEVGASSLFSGTYTIEDGKLSYDFGDATGFSSFTYDNNTLVLTNGNNVEIEKLTAADIMSYLLQLEEIENNTGILCLADLILNYYPDSEECIAATEKKDAITATIKAAGEAALRTLNTEYDKVQGLTWYEHKNKPMYIDTCCFIYPYIGRTDDGYTWLRVMVNYTDAKTNAGWIFFNKIIFCVDGENTTKYFNRNEIVRDNDTEVWETADFEPNSSEIQLLKDIANSTETIIRFEGDEYYDDHIVTAKEKQAILDVLAAYDYLVDYSE